MHRKGMEILFCLTYCLSHAEVLTVFQNVHVWAFQRKTESRATWSDIATQITWAFIGILKLCWERFPKGDRTTIIENDYPLQTLFEALIHEFLGSLPIDSSHHSQLFFITKAL